jgi:hypothetical protein
MLSRLSKFCRDPTWQFVAAIIGLVSLGYAVFYQLPRTKLAVICGRPTSILNSSLPDRLTMNYEGQAIRSLDSLEVQFLNNGNVPIRPSDFEHPFRLELGKGFSLVDARLTQSTPPNLRPTVTSDKASCSISPVLLNPDDAFIITLFVTGGSTPPAVSASNFDIRVANLRSPDFVSAEGAQVLLQKGLASWNVVLACAYIFTMVGLISYGIHRYFAVYSRRYAKRILGCWLGPRKFIIFHEDGTWGIKRSEDSTEDKQGKQWHVNGDLLALNYDGDRGASHSLAKIVSCTKEQMVLSFGDKTEEYTRCPV